MFYVKIPVKSMGEGVAIAEDVLHGSMMWESMPDGAMQAYPYDEATPARVWEAGKDAVSELINVLDSVLLMAPVWMPAKDKVSCEFGHEFEALSAMKRRIEVALEDHRESV